MTTKLDEIADRLEAALTGRGGFVLPLREAIRDLRAMATRDLAAVEEAAKEYGLACRVAGRDAYLLGAASKAEPRVLAAFAVLLDAIKALLAEVEESRRAPPASEGRCSCSRVGGTRVLMAYHSPDLCVSVADLRRWAGLAPAARAPCPYAAGCSMGSQSCEACVYRVPITSDAARVSGEEAPDARLREAALVLVARMAEVHDHPTFQAVWAIAQMHRGPYDGPQYVAELDALRAALAPSPEAKGDGAPSHEVEPCSHGCKGPCGACFAASVRASHEAKGDGEGGAA